MRVTREQAEKNHQAVINMASRLFREYGFDGIGLKDLMQGVGLTQGGFYKQFSSKKDLTVQASQRALETAAQRWKRVMAAKPEATTTALVDFYLSSQHRAERRDGCPMVALGSDVMRQDSEVKAVFESGIVEHLDLIAQSLTDVDEADRAERAKVMLATMVGALMLSRIVNDKKLSQSLLDTAAQEVKDLAAR